MIYSRNIFLSSSSVNAVTYDDITEEFKVMRKVKTYLLVLIRSHSIKRFIRAYNVMKDPSQKKNDKYVYSDKTNFPILTGSQ